MPATTENLIQPVFSAGTRSMGATAGGVSPRVKRKRVGAIAGQPITPSTKPAVEITGGTFTNGSTV